MGLLIVNHLFLYFVIHQRRYFPQGDSSWVFVQGALGQRESSKNNQEYLCELLLKL